MEKIFGIDISAYQGDFPLDIAISEGVQFVIIKAAGGDNGLYKDGKFERNYSFAKSLNLPIGCYFYSKALNTNDALLEANYLYENCLKGKNFSLPIYYDVEDQRQLSIGKENLINVVITFCNFIKNKGYKVGIYSSLSNINNYFNDARLNNYEKWIAQWSSNLSYIGNCGMWQFGGEQNFIRSNQVAGQVVDQDYMLYNYIEEVAEEEIKMTEADAINKVITIAQAEVGYHEKTSNYILDDKTANSGSGNYTKYARDLDAINGFYNGAKNGYAWCDVFVDWCFVKAFGAELAMKMLYQPIYSLGAGCTFSLGYYKENNAFSYSPKIGDQIFFGNSYESTHTGIVVNIENNIVYTIEGNTSDGVYYRNYSIGSSNILGYGTPNYSLACDIEIEIDDTIIPNDNIDYWNGSIFSIKDVQKFLNNNYSYLFENKLVEDGIYGRLTKEALVKAIQENIGVEITGIFSLNDKYKFPILKNGKTGNLVKLVQCGLICQGLSVGLDGADGDYGRNTTNAVKQFQRVKFLEIDGECGPETAYKLFN